MTVVFISNFFNHHQKPLSDAFYSLLGGNYYFIETKPISDERLQLGWGENEKPLYVKQSYISEDALSECKALIDSADVAIFGSAPYCLLKNRLKNNRITFVYSERIYKQGCPYYKLPRHFWIHLIKYIRYKSLYLLCASAFTSADFAKTFTFLNKAYKWGYFTELKYYDLDELIETKKHDSILWVGRFLDLKHPEIPVEIARRLKADGYRFEMNMIGTGLLEDKIKSLINDYGLSDYVHLLGAMKPDEVRKHMEESEIFLFTSDRNEGWGAVLNESMNSGCATIASHSIGSVPFLIEDGKNGLVYKEGDIEDLYQKTKRLLEKKIERVKIAKNAYNTIIKEWNAENAATRFIALSKELLNGVKKPLPFDCGICSKAEVLKDDWYI